MWWASVALGHRSQELAMTLIPSHTDFDTPRLAVALIEAFDRLGTRVCFAKDEEVYAQDDEAARFYRLLSGVVRTSRVTADGRRQVGDFYYPGDVFGLDPGPDHRFAAEALSDC